MKTPKISTHSQYRSLVRSESDDHICGLNCIPCRKDAIIDEAIERITEQADRLIDRIEGVPDRIFNKGKNHKMRIRVIMDLNFNNN